MHSPGYRGRRPSTHELLETLFGEAMAVVRAEYASRLTLADLAGRLATSPRQLRRAFAEIGGASFRFHLRAVRMERAADLLLATELSVKEVGARVGYREPSQFTKTFKQVHSSTPSSFRSRRPGVNRPTLT